MRTIIMYECEHCGCQYSRKEDAVKCETQCLGLTTKEYGEYMRLLEEEKCAFAQASIANNDMTRKRCDDAVKAVIEFEKKYNIWDESIERYDG